MRDFLKDICEKCQGHCCKSKVFVIKSDIDRLKKYKKNIKVHNEFTGKNKTPGYLVQDDEDKCVFLNLEKGCTLNHEDKPFDCRMFPIAMKYKDEKVSLHLNKRCKFWDEVPYAWVTETKKWAEKMISKLTKEEKVEFSKMAESYPKSVLMQL